MQTDNEKLFDTINALVDNASLIYQIYNEGPIIFFTDIKINESINKLIEFRILNKDGTLCSLIKNYSINDISQLLEPNLLFIKSLAYKIQNCLSNS